MRVARTKSAAARALVCGIALLSSDERADADAVAASESCEYMRVYIDPSLMANEREPGAIDAERARRYLLEMARDVYPGSGWEIVPERSDAYWTLRAYGGTAPGGFLTLVLALEANLRLQHHVFVAQLQDEQLPYRGELGGGHEYLLPAAEHPATLHAQVATDAFRMWSREFELLEAICAIGAELREQGWKGIGELRMELLDEMQRERRRREQEYRRRLELEIE